MSTCPYVADGLARFQLCPLSFRRRKIRHQRCRAKARRSRSRSDAAGGPGAAVGSGTIGAGRRPMQHPGLPVGSAFVSRELLRQRRRGRAGRAPPAPGDEPDRTACASQQLPAPGMAACAQQGRASRCPLPRSPAHRKHPGRQRWRTLWELRDRIGHDSQRAGTVYSTAATSASTRSRTRSASSPGTS
jgi:hypothetical protein